MDGNNYKNIGGGKLTSSIRIPQAEFDERVASRHFYNDDPKKELSSVHKGNYDPLDIRDWVENCSLELLEINDDKSNIGERVTSVGWNNPYDINEDVESANDGNWPKVVELCTNKQEFDGTSTENGQCLDFVARAGNYTESDNATCSKSAKVTSNCDIALIKSPEVETDNFHVDLRAKTTTPANYRLDSLLRFSSAQSRTTRPESTEAVYSEAVGRLTRRCNDARGTVDGSSGGRVPTEVGKPPLNCPTSCNIAYIPQNKPTPMPPLKVWTGYHGNVYFQPITCHSLRKRTVRPITSQTEPSELGYPIRNEKSQTAQTDPVSSLVRSRSEFPMKTFKLKQARCKWTALHDIGLCKAGQNQKLTERKFRFVRNDRKSKVSSSYNELDNFTVEMPECNEPKLTYDKEKICKGSVAHSLNSGRRNRKTEPNFQVAGDKFLVPPSMSPLLLAQTQYSRSAQRLAVISPDVSRLEKLPPLEQLRATLRRIHNSNNDGLPKRRYPLRPDTDMYQGMVKYDRQAKEQMEVQRRLASALTY